MTREDLRKEQGDSGNSSRASALEPLKSFGAAAGVLTGLAFIDGWLYWATYYTAFGLNSLVLDLPFSVVSVSLVQVLVRDWKSESGLRAILFLAAISGIALSILFVYWYKRSHPGATVPVLVLALGVSVGAWWLGSHDARFDSSCNSRLPNITFELIEPPDNAVVPPPCLQDSGQTCLLVLHTNNAYRYFVAPERPFCDAAWTSPGAGRMTYELFDSQIRIANILNHIGW